MKGLDQHFFFLHISLSRSSNSAWLFIWGSVLFVLFVH